MQAVGESFSTLLIIRSTNASATSTRTAGRLPTRLFDPKSAKADGSLKAGVSPGKEVRVGTQATEIRR